jgi:[acyl-carrier-protein] S-malonyltransferase
LYEKLETENVQPTIEQMKEAINMLKSVFATKGTLLDEQIERFNQLKDETGLEDFFSDIELPA